LGQEEQKELDQQLRMLLRTAVTLCSIVIEQVEAVEAVPQYQNNQQELLVQMVDLELPQVLDLVVDQEEATQTPVVQDHPLVALMVVLEVLTLAVEAVVLMMLEHLHQLTQMLVLLVVTEKHSLHMLHHYSQEDLLLGLVL
jgi:hypothetical protein